ncbi:STAS-like domain-containing protein [Flavobacterium aquiphilum]|uniref:STAS-like domain-containing protein n=1 Tax=Flavobacterium aquiphilum TaxID=3003261 RepID=UPI002480DB11|nr:DUF4325 domain-containing protein [Flavobacterium aquiphilum]
MIVKFSNFGHSLSSRLKGREVFNEIKPEVLIAEKIILDFAEIEIMTMSFGTELFDSINQYSNCEIEIINSNKFLDGVISFCKKNLKQLAY